VLEKIKAEFDKLTQKNVPQGYKKSTEKLLKSINEKVNGTADGLEDFDAISPCFTSLQGQIDVYQQSFGDILNAEIMDVSQASDLYTKQINSMGETLNQCVENGKQASAGN
jgi:hypothetical protein